MRAAVQLVLGTALAVAASGLTAAPASATTTGEPPGGTVQYQRRNVVCVNNGDSITIGGAVYMAELGKRGVTQFRVEWLLYDVSPYDHAVAVAKRRATYQSPTFPNTASNYAFLPKYNKQQWVVGPASDEGWWLIAKMTWVRAGQRDWNYKLPVARCG